MNHVLAWNALRLAMQKRQVSGQFTFRGVHAG
jgi:hypothetical protein